MEFSKSISISVRCILELGGALHQQGTFYVSDIPHTRVFQLYGAVLMAMVAQCLQTTL